MDTPIVVPINAPSSLAPASEAIRVRRVAPSPHAELIEARLAAEREAEALRKRVRELAAELAAAREAAVAHLARELHDGVGAELTAARFALANARHLLPDAAPPRCATALEVARLSLDAASEASRRVVEHLHAPALEAGIVCALSQWTESFAARTGLATSVVCAADVRLTQLPHAAALAIFRVAQEALSNVAKHAGATRADVRIATDRRYLTVIVEDDGRGLGRRASDRSGFGLAGMRARCEAFGGTLRVAPRKADGPPENPPRRGGTKVRARFAWPSMLAADARCRSASLS